MTPSSEPTTRELLRRARKHALDLEDAMLALDERRAPGELLLRSALVLARMTAARLVEIAADTRYGEEIH
jgi:hypothetical protein